MSIQRSVPVLAVLIAACACAAAPVSAVLADEWYDLKRNTLANFEFEGRELPMTAEQLKRDYPAARAEHDRVADAIGLECYAVEKFDNVDVARFFYCDGRLYQFEAEYKKPRIEQLGGMRTVLQSLIDTWGPVDHAGESRWTWQRPMYSRRADFFALSDRAQLTITDVSWMPVVAKRLVREEKTRRVELGVE